MRTSLNWICRSGRECSDTLAQALGEMEAAEESECTRGKQVRETSRDKIASTREESKLFASTSAQPRPLVLVRGPCRTPGGRSGSGNGGSGLSVNPFAAAAACEPHDTVSLPGRPLPSPWYRCGSAFGTQVSRLLSACPANCAPG